MQETQQIYCCIVRLEWSPRNSVILYSTVSHIVTPLNWWNIPLVIFRRSKIKVLVPNWRTWVKSRHCKVVPAVFLLRKVNFRNFQLRFHFLIRFLEASFDSCDWRYGRPSKLSCIQRGHLLSLQMLYRWRLARLWLYPQPPNGIFHSWPHFLHPDTFGIAFQFPFSN